MNRLRQLDGIRGCAIIFVLLWHYYCCWQVRAVPGTFAFQAKLWLGLTWSGVDLFFVLSGFLITGILLDNAKATNYFSTFYMRRACRILPLYYVLLLAYLLVTWMWSDKMQALYWLLKEPTPLWAHATFTQNIFMGAKNTVGSYWFAPTWSLAIEEQFYLVLPVLVYFLPRRVLPWLFAGMIILAPVLRTFAHHGLHWYVGAPWRADSLITGSLLAWCVREPALLEFFKAQRRRIYLIFGGLLAGAVIITWRGPKLGGVLDHFLLAALYGTLILLAYIDGEGVLARCLRTRVLVWFGTLSYGIYLFHQPVRGLVHAWLMENFPTVPAEQPAVGTLLALVITLGFAAFSFWFFERRFIEFGHKFGYRTESREGPALAPVLQPMGK